MALGPNEKLGGRRPEMLSLESTRQFRSMWRVISLVSGAEFGRKMSSLEFLDRLLGALGI